MSKKMREMEKGRRKMKKKKPKGKTRKKAVDLFFFTFRKPLQVCFVLFCFLFAFVYQNGNFFRKIAESHAGKNREK